MRGVDDAQAKKLGLLKADGKRKDYPDFKYLSKCNDLSRDDDIAEYNITKLTNRRAVGELATLATDVRTLEEYGNG